MGLNEDFDAAADTAANKLSNKTSKEEKKALYALLQQGKHGDNNTDKPGAINFLAKVKWEAWTSLKGKNQDEAKKEYIEKVNELAAKYGI